MHIATGAPIPDDDDDDVMAIHELEVLAALQEEEEEEVVKEKVNEEEEEEEQDTAHGMSDASSSTVHSSPEIKEEAMSPFVSQEHEGSVTIEPTTPPTTTTVTEAATAAATAAGSGGVKLKQEVQDGSSGNQAPIKTEPRPDPHLSSQSTGTRLGFNSSHY